MSMGMQDISHAALQAARSRMAAISPTTQPLFLQLSEHAFDFDSACACLSMVTHLACHLV